MKVALLNDLPVAGADDAGHGSGAELSSGAFIRHGHQRGHSVTVFVPETLRPNFLADYDLVVTKNVVGFNREQMDAVMKRPYVAWPSDYAWTRWRLFFSFQEEQRRLPGLERWHAFFAGSRLNVFLSPLHRDAYEWVIPGIVGQANVLSPPPVNVDLFHPDPKGWEPNTAATTNGGLDFKGLKSPAPGIPSNLSWAIDHPDVRFTFWGSIRDHVNLPPNAVHGGPVSQATLAAALGRTETYVELPSSAQPFNRTCVEGWLSCKRVVTNPLVGATTYPWFKPGGQDECRAVMQKVMPDLWEACEGAVGR